MNLSHLMPLVSKALSNQTSGITSTVHSINFSQLYPRAWIIVVLDVSVASMQPDYSVIFLHHYMPISLFRLKVV